MHRAIRCDGVMPIMRAENGEFMTIPTPADVREIRDYVRARRDPATPFDIIIEGSTPGDDGEEAASIVRPHAESGATWWIEAVYNEPGGFEGMRRRIKQGPPQIR